MHYRDSEVPRYSELVSKYASDMKNKRRATIAENITLEHERMQLETCLQRWKEQAWWRKDLC